MHPHIPKAVPEGVDSKADSRLEVSDVHPGPMRRRRSVRVQDIPKEVEEYGAKAFPSDEEPRTLLDDASEIPGTHETYTRGYDAGTSTGTFLT